MGFQKPAENELTDEQGQLLSQLSTVKNSLSSKLKVPKTLDPSQQISTFDYLKKITETTLGSASLDLFLKTFLDKLFDPNNNKLETMILKSMAKSLDKSGKKLSSTQTNQAWLLQNVLPTMNLAFRAAKGEIVKKIITMVFGPKENMSSDPVQQSYLLDAAVCSSDMFSVSNPTSDSAGDFEYNKVELKKRLQAGQVIFVISCQDVKIQLPQTIITQADSIIANNANPNNPIINPSVMFEQVNNTVSSETQRINAPENANAVRKNFSQIMSEKVINLVPIAIEPYIPGIISSINTSAGSDTGLSPSDFSVSPCDIRTMCTGNSPAFQQKSAFISNLMNSLYAYLLSILMQKLIKEVKALIKKYIVQKAQDALKRKLAKRQFLSDDSLNKLEKTAKFAQATASFSDIFKFGDT